MKKLISISLIAFMALLFAGCNSNGQGDEAQGQEDSVEATKASEFITNYSASQAEFDAKFLDKMVTVSGPVANAVEVDGGYNIEIKGQDDLQNVSCKFEKSAFKEGKLPKVGEEIVVKGKCAGYVEEEMMGLKTVNMVQCLIK